MNITWHGQTCFSLNFQKGKETINVLFNPVDKETGLKPVKKEPDILILTNGFEKKQSGFLIDGPGEYEIKGIVINGLYSFDNGSVDPNNTVYLLEGEDLKICHLGFLKQKELKKEQLDELGEIDILLLPIGKGAKEAVNIMSQIEPKIVIPMYYHVPGLKEKLEKLDSFLKILGIKSTESLAKLSVKKKDLLNQDPKIIILQN
ncbi:MAG: MBL fold metallo-hydrolase [Candidatus Pacebacteria bacterium]|nr:MBL fold metallo-hydrolase [Candidatus Paceibacterota bacterium]